MARQVAWLKSIVDAAGARKLLLFSHHQPFSQLDAQDRIFKGLCGYFEQATDSRMVLGA